MSLFAHRQKVKVIAKKTKLFLYKCYDNYYKINSFKFLYFVKKAAYSVSKIVDQCSTSGRTMPIDVIFPSKYDVNLDSLENVGKNIHFFGDTIGCFGEII